MYYHPIILESTRTGYGLKKLIIKCENIHSSQLHVVIQCFD